MRRQGWSVFASVYNSQAISLESSAYTFRRVVIARVAIDRFASVMRFSMSRLHVVTDSGCVMATWLRVRMAAKRNVALGADKNSCRTADGYGDACMRQSHYKSWFITCS